MSNLQSTYLLQLLLSHFLNNSSDNYLGQNYACEIEKILKCCARTPAQSLFVVSYFADLWEGLTLQVAVSTYIRIFSQFLYPEKQVRSGLSFPDHLGKGGMGTLVD